ncbi:MAG: DUF4838 domain-containing protein [Chloroflexia bacterium]
MTGGNDAGWIIAPNPAPPIALAARELAHYLALLAPDRPTTAAPLRLGTFADFGAGSRPWPAISSPDLDDAIHIEVDGGTGIIAGSNPRSVLLATYRFLTELGCRWVRPGPDGELIPRVDLATARVRVSEAAAYRHRGICIEGAASYEHVRDLIAWMPKVGLNTYFTQFFEAFTFFERWYAHRGNPHLPTEPFTVDRAREFKARLVEELRRRDLVFHDVGHGWTCEPLGIPGLGWDYAPPTVPPGVERYLAEVGGKRELWEGVPINTQLCYSDPGVRELLVGGIADYAAAHPEVDVIHFWLGDGVNNHCECAVCRELRPADWYVRLLNALDARLADRGLPTRIVFLVYFDLLWPPETERIANPDRFILMFAPITRTYSVPYAAAPDAGGPLPPFALNRLTLPRAVGENVAFLRAWQRLFAGDSFDYDYHPWRDHYREPGASPARPCSTRILSGPGGARVERPRQLPGAARLLSHWTRHGGARSHAVGPVARFQHHRRGSFPRIVRRGWPGVPRLSRRPLPSFRRALPAPRTTRARSGPGAAIRRSGGGNRGVPPDHPAQPRLGRCLPGAVVALSRPPRRPLPPPRRGVAAPGCGRRRGGVAGLVGDGALRARARSRPAPGARCVRVRGGAVATLPGAGVGGTAVVARDLVSARGHCQR